MNSENNRQSGDSSRLPPAKLVRRKQPWLVRELNEFDGADPRWEARKEERGDRRGKPDHSSERLARQMFDALAVETAVPSLEGLDGFAVASVRQRGPSNCYEVVVYHPDSAAAYDPGLVKRRLDEHRGLWRALVGQAITRKRVPDLVFQVLPPGVQP
jgi:hypothetical protein